MNCFHFSVSLGYTTTFFIRWQGSRGLWIAFIFQYLWDTQQHMKGILGTLICCELLSFFSIFGIHNNFFCVPWWWFWVVNCFHFSVSLGYTTTQSYLWSRFLLLWIAFIFQYLWDTQQPNANFKYVKSCCELLSFFSIFGIHNNRMFFLDIRNNVELNLR